MDVASRTTNVPISRRYIRQFLKILLIFLLLVIEGIGSLSWTSTSAWALTENQPIHHSGDKQVWDRKANIVELFGHAAVSQDGETLTADYIKMDMNTRDL